MSKDSSDLMRGSAQGSLILMIGQVVSTLMSAATVIWMARFLGSTAYGQYTIALFPVSIANLFQDLGINASLTRFCAKYRYEEQHNKLKSVVVTGLVFSIATSLVISGLIIIFAGPIASLYLKRPEIEPLVKAAALAVLGGGGLLTTVQAILVGYEIMTLTSLTQILWSVMRTLFSVVFLLVGLGAFGAVLGNTASQVVAGSVGTLLLFIFIKFERGSGRGFDWGMLRTFLGYGLPLSISALIGGVLSQIYNYAMVLYVATELIGNYGAASSFGVLLSFLMVPITTSLFPLYSKFKKDDPQLKLIFQMSVKYIAMLILPAVLAIIVIASPLSRLLYGANDYPYVPLYLSLFILTYAWEGLGHASLSNLISGVGESRALLNSSICTFFTGIIFVLILVPRYRMIGLLITMVLGGLGGWIYQILWAKKKLGITVDWRSMAKIYASAIAAFAGAYLIVNVPNLYGWSALILGGLTYLIIYLICLPLSGALRREDFAQLNKMSEILGPLHRMFEYILYLIGRLARD
jgi:O-antigen/teichoic acid export membrane protein